MTLEYLTVAKLGGKVVIPNNTAQAEEMFEQLQAHNILFYKLPEKSTWVVGRDYTKQATLIARMLLHIELDGYSYHMKEGDTVFLRLNDE